MVTDNFIKMCEQAKEIQQAWKPKIGDYFLELLTKSINIYTDGFAFLPQHNVPLSILYIWLPTQEQLQEMISGDFKTVLLIDDFYNFAIENLLPFDSMNELWLAFVMKEKWNKTWDGKKWKE